MKKRAVVLMTMLLFCLPLLYGCGNVENGSGQDIVIVDVDISEEYYVTMVGDIINNFTDYEGKTVRIEGVFQVTGHDTVYRMVMRQDLSC